MICGVSLDWEGQLVFCEEAEGHSNAHHAILRLVTPGDVVGENGEPAEGTEHPTWWTLIPPPQRMVWFDIEGEVEK